VVSVYGDPGLGLGTNIVTAQASSGSL
jgi:hypothetical protein